MNEFIKKSWYYVFKNIKTHPIQSLITCLTAIGVIFTIVSNTHVDLYITSQQVQADTDAIKVLSTNQRIDQNDILLLQQIAKDNVAAQANFANQLQRLNDTFDQYLLNKIK